ncbi:transcription termination factor MTERF15, mitochondrial-like [Carex rostrata]
MSTAAILYLRRLPRLRSSLPLTNFTSSFYRLLSTAATTRSPPPNPHFAAVDYLIQSYGLPYDEALRASKRIQHLKSPDKPDAVLCFLRQTGISESDIRTAVSRDPRILVSHVEKNWRPNVVKLQEIGLSIEDISGIISRNPGLFQYNILPKIDFWMRALGSLENMSVLLKRGPTLINCSLEKVLVPNLSFLQKQCGLSVRQIVRLIKSASQLISLKPEAIKIKAKRAEELLGISCSSQMFVHALSTVAIVNESTIISRVDYLKSLGLSQEEVAIVICKVPMLLQRMEESLGRKMEFLMKEAGCGKIDVVHNPVLLCLSLEKRLIPRNLVRKLLKSKEFPVANKAFASFMQPSEKDFLEKFVIPYEHDIPGLGQAYADAYSGNTGSNK